VCLLYSGPKQCDMFRIMLYCNTYITVYVAWMPTAAAQYLLTYNYISKKYGGSSDAARCALMMNGLPGGLTARYNDVDCSSRVLLLGGRRDGSVCVYNWNTGAVDYVTEVLALFGRCLVFAIISPHYELPFYMQFCCLVACSTAFCLMLFSSHGQYGCGEVRIQIRQHSNFECFQQIRNSSNVLSALLSNAISWKNPCSMTDFLCTARSRLLLESADKLFSKIQLPITTKLQLLNVQHNFCSVMCYTVLI